MPRERRALGQSVQCVPGEARRAREAGERGDLSVGRDLSARHAAHDREDLRVGRTDGPRTTRRAGREAPHGATRGTRSSSSGKSTTGAAR